MNVKLKILLISSSFGIAWGGIYLIFSFLHSMTEMFNKDFILLIANIFKIKITTTLNGFIYAFFDGFLAGAIVGILFLILKWNFIDKS